MADTATTVTTVAATVQQMVAQQIQLVLNANVVTPGSVTMQVAPAGVDKIKIPRIGKFAVQDKAAGVAVSAQANTYATDDLALTSHKVIQFLIEDVANLQSSIDITQSAMTQAGVDMAVSVDQFIIDKLELVSAAAPDHKIAYAGASIGKADILAARALLNNQNVPLADRFLGLHPDQESAVLGISEFTRVDEAGGSLALRNGEIGKLYGFTILLSSQFESLKSLAYHKSHVAFGMQMAPKVEFFRDVPNLSDRWSISQIFGGVTQDGGKRGVLLGTAL